MTQQTITAADWHAVGAWLAELPAPILQRVVNVVAVLAEDVALEPDVHRNPEAIVWQRDHGRPWWEHRPPFVQPRPSVLRDVD
jgi:hypothetical protein